MQYKRVEGKQLEIIPSRAKCNLLLETIGLLWDMSVSVEDKRSSVSVRTHLIPD
jgi:hypothetical protein